MTTVQDLINMHKAAQEFEYSNVRIRYIDGHSEGFSNVNNLQADGAKITFVSTYIPCGEHDTMKRQVREVFIRGEIISTVKQIL